MINKNEMSQSEITLSLDQKIQPESSRLQAYVELTKLRISVMVLITFIVTGVLAAHAAGATISLSVLLSATLGMFLIAASGNAMNMYLERYSDFLMPRTAGRPLPTQRLSATEVAMFATITFGVGSAVLLQAVNWQTAVCGIANWVLYAFVYTPLKRRHWSNTEVGAVAGAMPIVMGSLATTGTVGLIGGAFFGVLLLWQFPHFMAIAWKYRQQYEAGGLKNVNRHRTDRRRSWPQVSRDSRSLATDQPTPPFCLRNDLAKLSVVSVCYRCGGWLSAGIHSLLSGAK